MSFTEYNANPSGKIRFDCVIRAICTAEGRPYIDVLDDMNALGRELFTVCNDKVTVEKYLKNCPTINVFKHVDGKKKRMTVADICRLKGECVTYIVKTAGHLTCVKNGVIYDTWDCSQKCAYKIWRVRD